MNYLPELLKSNNLTSLINNPGTDYGDVRMHVQDSVEVTVKRNRWYGEILESSGRSYLYLFGKIPLPLKDASINFIYFHKALVIILMSIMLFNLSERRYQMNNLLRILLVLASSLGFYVLTMNGSLSLLLLVLLVYFEFVKKE